MSTEPIKSIWLALRRDGGREVIHAYRPEPRQYPDHYKLCGPFKTVCGAEYLRDNWDAITCHDDVEAIEALAHGGDPAPLKSVKRLLGERQSWSRHVGCGFSASEVKKVTQTHVTLQDGRSFKLDVLNRRELEETLEGLRLLNADMREIIDRNLGEIGLP